MKFKSKQLLFKAMHNSLAVLQNDRFFRGTPESYQHIKLQKIIYQATFPFENNFGNLL